MSIFDRARDALKSPHSFVYGGEYAAAVVRVAALADELDAEGAGMCEERDPRVRGMGLGYRGAAARIRQVFEGSDQ